MSLWYWSATRGNPNSAEENQSACQGGEVSGPRSCPGVTIVSMRRRQKTTWPSESDVSPVSVASSSSEGSTVRHNNPTSLIPWRHARGRLSRFFYVGRCLDLLWFSSPLSNWRSAMASPPNSSRHSPGHRISPLHKPRSSATKRHWCNRQETLHSMGSS